MPTVLEATDARVAELIAAEEQRQHDTLCLIPSENHVSPAVLAASGSCLMNKYSEGYPGRRYYQGNTVVDDIEVLAARRARELFGVEHANVQPLSGAPANLAVYAAFLPDVNPASVVPGYLTSLGRALLVRRGLAELATTLTPYNDSLQNADTQKHGPALAAVKAVKDTGR